MDRLTIKHGDCRQVMAELPADSIDSCITDPPYELNFMNRRWDNTGVAYDIKVWSEVLRALKPGAHLLAFGGTRTAHRMAVAIEDAGFEIRDSIHWMYGSGFPKSLDISKAIDKVAGAEREIIGEWKMPGRGKRSPQQEYGLTKDEGIITAPATDLARLWQGWGTALKPAHEIIYLCRKPLSESSITANVLRWGTGALNINACRIKTTDDTARRGEREALTSKGCKGGGWSNQTAPNRPRVDMTTGNHPQGRWPANVILSHSPACEPNACHESCPVAELNGQSGNLQGRGNLTATTRKGGQYNTYGKYNGFTNDNDHWHDKEGGGASRFYFTAEWSEADFIPLCYYVAKASRGERDQHLDNLTDSTMNRVNPGGLENDPRWKPITVKNAHPTVKPVTLLAYLCKLITPSGGTVLDCFAGSGSCGRAAIESGFNALLIEQDQTWIDIINARCATQIGLPFA